MLSLMWNLKYDTNELIYETETDSQRTDLWLPKQMEWGGADGVGVWDYQIQTIIYMYKTRALCYTPETNTPL